MLAALVCLATFGGCNCPLVMRCPEDAGCTDAARAPRDAGHDASGDAGNDGGLDAGRDSGPRRSAEWSRFGGLPDECPIEIALRPENVPVDVIWESCGEGCQRWIGSRGLRWLSGAEPGRAWVSILEETSSSIRSVVLLDLASGPVAALRETPGPRTTADCFVLPASLGSDAAVTASFAEYDAAGSRIVRSWARFYRGTIEQLPDARLLHHHDDFADLLQTLRVSPTRIAMEASGASAYVVDDDGTFTIANRSLYPHGVQELHLVGDDIFWTDWNRYVSLARSTRATSDGTIFHSVEGGDVRSFSTDGVTFAWLHAFDQAPDTLRYARVELWTATYDGAQFNDTRHVADVPAYEIGVSGDGLFAISEREPPEDSEVLAVYRLADGARATFTSPDGRYGNIAYVSGTDILMDVPGAPLRIDPRTLSFE